jgi:hypothetical protein
MTIVLIILTTLISASLFDILPGLRNAGKVLNLQRKSLNVLRDQRLTEEQKQKLLLSLSGEILFTTCKLILVFAIAIMPIMGLVIIGDRISQTADFEEFVISLPGISLSCLTFLFYYFVKKVYGKFRV